MICIPDKPLFLIFDHQRRQNISSLNFKKY
jgi:hypothetical protein